MPSAHHPVVKATAAARYAPILADPLNPVAEQVGKAVAAKLHGFKVSAAPGKRALVDASKELRFLERELSALIAEELRRSLSSPTAEGKAIRMALIAKLAGSEMEGTAVSAVQQPLASDTMLTTAEAAAKLETSRPYVSMLCDQGKLGEVLMTEGGHRRIRSSAVAAYLADRTKQHVGAKSPREAAVDAGLYEFPEKHFKNVVRPKQEPGEPVKAARKRRT